jgi:hypothetical protein
MHWKYIAYISLSKLLRRTEEVEVQLHSFLTSALAEGEWLTSRPGRFNPRKNPNSHWLARPQGRSGRFGKDKNLLTTRAFESRPIQAVDSHYRMLLVLLQVQTHIKKLPNTALPSPENGSNRRQDSCYHEAYKTKKKCKHNSLNINTEAASSVTLWDTTRQTWKKILLPPNHKLPRS